ncbi:FAD-binding domain-containing protein [Lactarius quietus]|nr:FAD-binding domain-containing protein [Lactarius quietus]
MLSVFFAFSAFTLVSRSLATGIPGRSTKSYPQQDFQAVCNQISSAISNSSQVFYPSEAEYVSDNEHWYASSSQESACSVEPGSAQDVSLILQILGKSRTPFGVKSGGHAVNHNFSSTHGVQISLARFDTFEVDSEAQTVDLGPSLLWEDVYDRLDPYGVTVIGGRIPGVGVGGLMLGGGYSFRSNEFGLAIDNIVALELVLPNGTITTVTEEDHDLWFAIRGSGNNFGIVTKFTLKSYPQGEIWGGDISYGSDQLEAVKIAIAEFGKVTDTNATLLPDFLYSSGEVVSSVILFYNAPQPPSGIFDTFLQLPSQQKNIQVRSYADIVNLQAAGHFCGFPTTNYSLPLLDAMANQVEYWGTKLTPLDPSVLVLAFVELFDRGLFTHGQPSAYPPDRSLLNFPSNLAFTWLNSSLDDTMTRAIREAGDNLRAAALKDGQNIEHAAVYPNYALFDTPLEDMYGPNVPRLRALRQAIDPEDVMGLAGGFKF